MCASLRDTHPSVGLAGGPNGVSDFGHHIRFLVWREEIGYFSAAKQAVNVLQHRFIQNLPSEINVGDAQFHDALVASTYRAPSRATGKAIQVVG